MRKGAISGENRGWSVCPEFPRTVRMNTFWDITDGAKAGGEFIWGNRSDKDRISGDALRFNLLFYYDF